MTTASAPSSPSSPARDLDAALARIRSVFDGMTAAPDEEGCTYCYGEQEIALLRQPRVELPEDLLVQVFHEVPDHFTDHPAVIRRLLPQFAGHLAAGRFGGLGYGATGLGRCRWPQWPAEQADAIRKFIDAWWAACLTDESSPYDITDVFAVCADMGGTITPLLEYWARQPVGGRADELLRRAVEWWMPELFSDLPQLIIPWWYWPDPDAPVFDFLPEPLPELQAWLAVHAPERLRAVGATEGLCVQMRLLALPYDARWDDPYWDSPEATN
ncbi:hypothetical protein ACIBKX_26740 [Streptomyces sp. NPDC050658]|uniref:hypothetical protein n=1 Tax=unclassified Streptomyces TaxID=2593676 RepID=UPI0034411D33